MNATVLRALRNAVSAQRGIDEFVYVTEARSSACIELVREGGKFSEARSQSQGELTCAHVYLDRRQGRGSASFTPLADDSLKRQLSDAQERAILSLGPAWELPPPAAAARVAIAAPLLGQNLMGAASSITSELRQALPKTLRLVESRVTVQHGRQQVVMSTGVGQSFNRSEIELVAELATAKGYRFLFRRRARRPEDLAIAAALAKEAVAREQGEAIEPGTVDLVIDAGAFVPTEPAPWGIWTPLAQQCNAERARKGLARFQLGQNICEGETVGDKLTLRSIGSWNYGLHSSPLGPLGEPVRNFTLVDKGQCVGQAVSFPEAQEGAGANGGVRNLLIPDTSKDRDRILAPSRERPLLIAHSIDSLETEVNGVLLMTLGRGSLARHTSTIRSATQGGVVSGNLFQWLRDAQFAGARSDVLWYRGPRYWRFNGVGVG